MSMGIQILSPEVINQIAAGEVLERPSNLIKELIENSLDAQATSIEIDIDQGGRFLRIQDNGHGMGTEDLEKSILRHATSKIDKFGDLWSLSSYGFRGEALASAAAVSEMTIKSKKKNQKTASVLKSEFGTSKGLMEQAGDVGTQITIEKLFENVPARLKFLKTDAAETSQILRMIKAFALSHPQVEFKVRVKNILKLFYPKTESLVERVQLVLEQKELFQTQQQRGSQHVEAIYSAPNSVSRTAQNIWIFVQRRWVQDRAIQRAILDAYQNLLMHGEYPYCVLFLDCDPQTVDVNIHPTKSQVKFQDASLTFRNVFHTLREALEQAPWLKRMFESGSAEENPFQETEKAEISEILSVRDFPALQTTSPSATAIQGAVESYSQGHANQSSFMDSTLASTLFKQKNIWNKQQGESAKTSFSSREEAPPETTGLDPHWGTLQVLGQLNQTYVLAQSRTALFLIDQHASHERVMFEKLMQSWRDQEYEVQSFLIPISLDLSAEKVEAVTQLSEEFKKMGIEVEPSSPESISIYAAPALIKETALVEAILNLTQDFQDLGGGFQIQKKLTDVFATMACHSAIRAGQALSLEEMQELLHQMDLFPLSSFCPHGRPVFKQITFYELDKDFGRIV